MTFLLDLPVWISFTIVSAITVTIALWGLHFVRKKFAPEALKENHEVASIIFNVFGLLYAVVVAFVVFVTWNGYDEATKNLQMEANETIDIFYSAKAYPDSVSKIVQTGLIDYAGVVLNDELKEMSEGDIGIYTGGALKKLLMTFNSLSREAAPNRELYSESLKRVNNLAEYRRLRIFAGNDTIPDVIWFVLVVGAIITVTYTYFFGSKSIKAQYLMTSALTITITFILFLIFTLDHPFSGTSKVSERPMRQVLEIMQKGL